MRKYYSLVACLALAAMSSCGGKGGDNGEAKIDSVVAPVSTHTTDTLSDRTWEDSRTEKVGGHEYSIDIKRHPDKALEKVKDELGQYYYDNSVDISIYRDGSAFVSKTFTKEAFLDFLKDGEDDDMMLQGIAFDKSDAEGLHFGAQLGMPGDDAGPLFTLTISTSGGISITRAEMQDVSPE